jgi:hypothetical protein
LLGVGDKTYTRWETGRSVQNKANDTLIRLIDMNAEPFSLLEAERDPKRDALVGRYFDDLTQLKGQGGTWGHCARTVVNFFSLRKSRSMPR